MIYCLCHIIELRGVYYCFLVVVVVVVVVLLYCVAFHNIALYCFVCIWLNSVALCCRRRGKVHTYQNVGCSSPPWRCSSREKSRTRGRSGCSSSYRNPGATCTQHQVHASCCPFACLLGGLIYFFFFKWLSICAPFLFFFCFFVFRLFFCFFVFVFFFLSFFLTRLYT